MAKELEQDKSLNTPGGIHQTSSNFIWTRDFKHVALKSASTWLSSGATSIDGVVVLVTCLMYMPCLLYTSPSPRDRG
eukprot:5330753-Amphidinium_carterae.1